MLQISNRISEPDLLIILICGNMFFCREDGMKIILVGCLNHKKFIFPYRHTLTINGFATNGLYRRTLALYNLLIC